MRVICVDASGNEHSIVKEGETYNTIREVDIYGMRWYELEEHPKWFYQKRQFIPCSEIDELELVNEKEEVV